MYKEARQLFKEPEVIDTNNLELKWSKPNDEGVIDFLVKEKSFNEETSVHAYGEDQKSESGVASQNRLNRFSALQPSRVVRLERKEPERRKEVKVWLVGSRNRKV